MKAVKLPHTRYNHKPFENTTTLKTDTPKNPTIIFTYPKSFDDSQSSFDNYGIFEKGTDSLLM